MVMMMILMMLVMSMMTMMTMMTIIMVAMLFCYNNPVQMCLAKLFCFVVSLSLKPYRLVQHFGTHFDLEEPEKRSRDGAIAMATDGPNAMFGSTTSGIPLSTLDYGYIGKCTNVSELEKIVKVLRSGDEGLYPELILFAEKQLESIHPKRFNPDEELKLLEEKEDRELKIKREQAELNAKEAELPSEVETIGKTDAELNVLADREKDKGNEAFRCGDYRESLVYYSRSINYKPTAASHNNRAFANLKLEKYLEAVEDCNVVVSMEPNNLKAFLRRALAHKNRGEGISAREDLNKVLEIEPNNKRAKRKGKRLKIIEVENDEEPAVVGEEKEIEKNIDENGSSSHESTDGNCLSSSTNGSSPTERSNLSTSDTSEETKTETPVGSDTDTVITPTKSDDSEAQTSNGVVEKGRTEISASQPVNSSPPLVELPGIVLKAKDEGTSLYKLGRYAEATEKFTMAIEILEKDKSQFLSALSSLLNNRAACLQRIGDASGCVKDCTASLGLIPGSVKPLLKRAASNEMLEKYEQSYLDYNSVIFVDPINQAAMQGKSSDDIEYDGSCGIDWCGMVTMDGYDGDDDYNND
ncbi:hypothetical protein QZH41_005119 [Actinostola sp. cb2023]|nr:hypothetical protein QZH41_005119 [Actinostola sp. cb2023]